jgi:hypothetical protein
MTKPSHDDVSAEQTAPFFKKKQRTKKKETNKIYAQVTCLINGGSYKQFLYSQSGRVLSFGQISVIIKCKAIPLQALTGAEVSRSMRLPNFKIVGA